MTARAPVGGRRPSRVSVVPKDVHSVCGRRGSEGGGSRQAAGPSPTLGLRFGGRPTPLLRAFQDRGLVGVRIAAEPGGHFTVTVYGSVGDGGKDTSKK